MSFVHLSMGVMGMTDLLLDTSLDDEQRQYAEAASVSANTLLSVVNNILDFSKIEAGKIDMESVRFNLSTILEDVADMVSVKAYEKGIEYVYMIHPEVPTDVRGDPIRLLQVLANLVNNAVKFTDHGEISVDVSLVDDRGSKTEISFEVKDTGVGIAADGMERLFKSFSQVDASMTRRHGGTGLGLAISKRLVELMGGRIGVESEEGKGSKFWFTVVLDKEAQEVTGMQDRVKIEGRRVLIAEPQRTIQSVLAAYLHSWGCRVEVSENLHETLRLIRNAVWSAEPFDVVIIANGLLTDGPGFPWKKTFAEDVLKKTSIILLRSLGDEPIKSFGGEYFCHSLTKPVKPSLLYGMLAGIAAGREKETAGPAKQEEKARSPRESIRILIAEDNRINQMVAKSMVERSGYHAHVVGTGGEAVEAVMAGAYDLVLMDVQMPDMNGFEATNRIREVEGRTGKHIPVVAMTAHALKDDRQACLDAGMDDYVSKPVRPWELERVIGRFFEGIDQGNTGEVIDPASSDRSFPIDRALLLSRVGGDQALCDELIALFIEDFPLLIKELKKALPEGDMAAMQRLAHKMKGAAANIEAHVIRELVHRLEGWGTVNDPESALTVISDLELEFDRLADVCKLSRSVTTVRGSDTTVKRDESSGEKRGAKTSIKYNRSDTS